MRKQIALWTIAAFVLFPLGQAQAHIEVGSHGIEVPARVHPAVFTDAEASMRQLKTKMDLGQATPQDYALAASSMRTMFGHMEQTGLTSNIEYAITHNQIPKEAYANVTDEDREAFVSFVREHGVAAIHQQIVSALESKSGERLHADWLDPRSFGNMCLGLSIAGIYGGVIGFVVGGPIGTALFWTGLGMAGISFAVC